MILVEFGWSWIILDDLEWFWMILDDLGWSWMILDDLGWSWDDLAMMLDDLGWPWIILVPHQKTGDRKCLFDCPHMCSPPLHFCWRMLRRSKHKFGHCAHRILCNRFKLFQLLETSHMQRTKGWQRLQERPRRRWAGKPSTTCIFSVVLHLPLGHLPPPFLWHLPPLF